MILKADGKNIDTLPITALLSQEEAGVDVVEFEVDRFHDGTDLAEFSFLMRGVTEAGGEMQTSLVKTVQESVLHLTWKIGSAFTSQPGTLQLDLVACDAQNTRRIRYQLPPVQIRRIPPIGEEIQSTNLTSLLMQLQEAANAAIAEIQETGGMTEERIATLDNLTASISTMQSELQFHDNSIKMSISTVRTHSEQILALQEAVQTVQSIVSLTESEYAALAEPDAATLYLVTEEY